MNKKDLIHVEVIGKGKPEVALIACMHGDEIIGLRVFGALKKDARKMRGALALITAHPRAIVAKKRYINEDLNRVFPGKSNGSLEQKIAFLLLQEVRKYKIVVDIHATNSNIDALVITTKKNQAIKKLLNSIPSKKAAFIGKNIFGGHELISHVRAGISLEYGPNKSGSNYKRALKDVNALLRSLDLKAKGNIFHNKEHSKIIFKVFDVFKIPKSFKQASHLNDFHYIKKGEVVGFSSKKAIIAPVGFYPLFLGRGRYHSILALMARKIN